MKRAAVIVVGAQAAESDYQVAQELKTNLKSNYFRIQIKKDNEINIIDNLFRDIICVGGPKVNKISAKYSTIVTGPRIEIGGDNIYIRDSYGNTCFKNEWNKHVGIISSGQKTMFSKVYIIAGMDRCGTKGSGKIFGMKNGQIENVITVANNNGNPTGYTNKCGGKFINL